MAHGPAPWSWSPITLRLKRNLQLPGGSPYPCSHSTKPSWQQTIRPSNWRSQHRNRKDQPTARNPLLGSGSPCHELDSTTPSWQRTTRPANLRNHPGNCWGLGGLATNVVDPATPFLLGLIPPC